MHPGGNPLASNPWVMDPTRIEAVLGNALAVGRPG